MKNLILFALCSCGAAYGGELVAKIESHVYEYRGDFATPSRHVEARYTVSLRVQGHADGTRVTVRSLDIFHYKGKTSKTDVALREQVQMASKALAEYGPVIVDVGKEAVQVSCRKAGIKPILGNDYKDLMKQVDSREWRNQTVAVLVYTAVGILEKIPIVIVTDTEVLAAGVKVHAPFRQRDGGNGNRTSDSRPQEYMCTQTDPQASHFLSTDSFTVGDAEILSYSKVVCDASTGLPERASEEIIIRGKRDMPLKGVMFDVSRERVTFDRAE
mgnify:CR=1 FL=1